MKGFLFCIFLTCLGCSSIQHNQEAPVFLTPVQRVEMENHFSAKIAEEILQREGSAVTKAQFIYQDGIKKIVEERYSGFNISFLDVFYGMWKKDAPQCRAISIEYNRLVAEGKAEEIRNRKEDFKQARAREAEFERENRRDLNEYYNSTVHVYHE